MHAPDTTLQIYHRSFKIPLETYLNAVSDFLDPWEERAYQYVVQQSLAATHDRGIVGMVRQEKDENYVYLDAAIRYTISEYGREKGPLIMDGGKGQRAINCEKGRSMG